MKRIFTLIGFTYLFCLFAAISFDFRVSFYIAISSLVILIISIFVRKKISEVFTILCIITITSSIAFATYCVNYFVNILPIESIKGKETYVYGELCEPVYENYGKYYYVIKTETIDCSDTVQNTKIRLSAQQMLEIEPYDKIYCKVSFSDYVQQNSGLSSEVYLKSKGIYLTGFIYEYDPVNIEHISDKPVEYYPLFVKEQLVNAFCENLPPEYSAIICGVLLGEKHLINSNIVENFRISGISHLLCVSGLHLSVISGFIFLFLRSMRCNLKLSAIISVWFIVVFMCITGFSSSVIRAGIMSIIYYIGLAVNRKSDSINSLGFAVFIMCLTNPFSSGDIGLLLSSFSTLGMIIIYPRITIFLQSKNILKSFVSKFLCETIVLTISAIMFTAPILISVFKEFSIISVVSNLLVVFPAMIMLICSAMFLPFYFITGLNFISEPLLYISAMLAKYVSFCTEKLSSIPFASLNLTKDYIIFWVIASVILFAVMYLLGNIKKHIKITSLLSVIILMFGILSCDIINFDVTTFNVLATNGGCNVFLTKGNRSAVICCGGNSYTNRKISAVFNSNNIETTDYILISQINDYTSFCAYNIINKSAPKVISLNKSAKLNDETYRSLNGKNNIVYYKDYMNCKLWANTEIFAVSKDKNTYISLKINDVKFLIIPMGGDIPNNIEGFYDFIVIGDLPNNIDKIKSQYCILTMYKDDAYNSLQRLEGVSGNAILTYTQGDISIDCTGGKSVQLRRENY